AAAIAFTSDLINRLGLITPPKSPIREGTSLTPFLTRALQCDFDCYLTEQVIPMWRARTDGGSLLQLIDQVSLYALQAYPKASPKIAVMHNADDVILVPGDRGGLRKTVGARRTGYPHGVHSGNLNYRVNSDAMRELFGSSTSPP
ncbi:serine/threonine protein kinase, partial [Pseudomonas sp. MWU12-2534b]